MRKALVSLLFLFASFSLFSQTFSLTDTKFAVGSYYRTYGIRFYLSKADVMPDCFSLLDSISSFIKNNPKLKFEIGVHSDSRGSDLANTNITKARAKSIKNYILSKGIDANRLVAKGYGESKLLVPDSKISKLTVKEEIEIAHQKNRRVEFIILAI